MRDNIYLLLQTATLDFLFWHATVDKVIVNADESVVFGFKNGSEVEV